VDLMHSTENWSRRRKDWGWDWKVRPLERGISEIVGLARYVSYAKELMGRLVWVLNLLLKDQYPKHLLVRNHHRYPSQ
jgi:hypothetical protein